MWRIQLSSSGKPYYTNGKTSVWKLETDVSAAYDTIASSVGKDEDEAPPDVPHLHVRRRNNEAKRQLFSSLRYTRVLDLCCGKGGDTLKHVHNRLLQSYVGIDVSPRSVAEARRRMRDPRFTFLCGDLTCRHTWNDIMGGADLVSMQFALHYFFSSRALASECMQHISARLVDGGHFVATIVSDELLRPLLRRRCSRIAGVDIEGDDTPYGAGYTFAMTGSVPDVREYVVPTADLEDVCAEHGLVLVRRYRWCDDPTSASSLYCAVVFRKVTPVSPDDTA